MSAPEILPDSRAMIPRGAVQSKVLGGVFWVPVFCASCHCEGGLVPEENMTFAFWLCDSCFASYGSITCTMVMPDQVFFQKVKEEQLEKYGRELSPEKLKDVADANSSPLATLIREGR